MKHLARKFFTNFLQSAEERQWFADRFETLQKEEIAPDRLRSYARSMQKSLVNLFAFDFIQNPHRTSTSSSPSNSRR